MATTQNTYTGNGSTTDYSITFEYLKDADVKVTLDHVATTAFTLPNATTLRFTTAPGNNVAIRIFRDTDVDAARFVYSAGSAIKAAELNENADQTLYALQETVNTDDITDQAVTTAKLFDGAVTDAKLNNLNVTTPKIRDEAVTTAKIAADAVNGSKIADDSIDSEHYVDGSIDTAHIADSQVTTAKIADASVTTAKIADNAVTAAKIPDSTLVSAKYANQSVGTAALADSNVTTAKIADGAITTDKLNNVNVTTAKIADGAITTDKLNNLNVTTAKIADGAITTDKLNNLNVTTAKIADGAITAAKLNGAAVVTNSEHSASTPDDTSFFTTSASDARYFRQDSTETITSGVSWTSDNARVATTGAIDARIIDLVEEVGGFVPIANETSFPTANPDVNDAAGTIVSVGVIGTTRTPSSGVVTITDGAGTGNDVTITAVGSQELTSGFGMLVETTNTLHTYSFHRLTPPATNVNTVATNITDVNTVADNDANITTVAGIDSDVTTVANNNANVTTVAGSIANVNTAAGSISNINTVANDLNEATSEIDTVATNIANVNTVGNDITNVNTVATNISSVNSFSDVYRIASSDPTTSLDVGDLVFNTTNNALRVYNGTSWQDGVTASGNFMSKTGDAMSGNLNMQTNKVENVGDATADGDAVSKSFMDSAIDTALTSDVIGGQSITVTDDSPASGQISIAVTGSSIGTTQLSDSGVTTAKLADDAVTGAKIADDAVGAEHIEVLDANLQFADNVKAQFGTGNDLEIYHTGTNTHLSSNTAGTLFIDQNSDDGDINIRSDNGTGGITKYILCDGSEGAVNLYHYGAQKLITKSDGVDINGELQCDTLDVDGAAAFTGGTASFGNSSTGFSGTPVFAYANTTASNQGTIQAKNFGSGGANFIGFDGSGNATSYINTDGSASFYGNVDLQDNDKLLLGNSDDIEIYHDGTNSSIVNNTGDLYLQGSGDDVVIRAADDIFIQPQNGESGIQVLGNNAVKLAYDGNFKFETKSDGVDVTGELQSDSLDVDGNADINGKLSVNEIDIRDNGSSSPLLSLRADDSSPWAIIIGNDTYSSALGNGFAGFLSNDGDFFWNLLGSGAYRKILLQQNNGSSTRTGIEIDTNSSVNLRYQDSIKLATKSDGVDITGELQCDSLDNDGASSFAGIATFNGNYTSFNNNGYIRGDSSGVFQLQAGGNNEFRFMSGDNGTKYVEITSGGLNPGANNTFDLGTSSVRWRNIYTNDMNLSNEGSVNDVDGTWGSYTIQEGEDDLFLINRRNGKKYKFNLTEVN